MGVMGRPEKKIDWERVAKLARVQTPRTAIAAIVSCSVPTLERAAKREHGKTFTDYVEGYAAMGRAAIQEELYDRAFDRDDKFSGTLLLYVDKKYVAGGLPEQGHPATQAQAIQVISSATATVALLREILGKPKLVTSGENDE